MTVHTSTVLWQRGAQHFVDNRYSRRPEIRFDGGAAPAGASSPQRVVRTEVRCEARD